LNNHDQSQIVMIINDYYFCFDLVPADSGLGNFKSW
jgi:hypothetical protein